MIRNNIRTILSAATVGLASLVAVPHLLAQDTTTRVNIPFSFQCEHSTLPAGRYDISMPSDRVIELRGHNSALGMVGLSQNKPGTKGDKLVFARYGDTYILKEVWLPGDTEHAVLLKTRSQRRLEQVAQNSSESNSTVEVALLDSPR